jgi:hypothetical protein
MTVWQRPKYAILGPCPCQECGALVYWGYGLTRVDGEVAKGLAWWREPSGRVHSHVPVPALRRTLRPRPKTTPNPHPMLANARAAWDNRAAGTSSQSVTIAPDADLLLVPGRSASLRSEGRD